MLAAAPAANETSAARRRQRRLRQFLRHEPLTVAMLLAERPPHRPTGLKQARSGGVEREVNYEPRLLYPPLPQVAATVSYVAAPGPLLCTVAGGHCG